MIIDRIAELRPRAGDTLAVSVAGRLTLDQCERIRQSFSTYVPSGVKVMVLDSTVSLTHIAGPQAEHEPVAGALDFDAWMRERTERAHSAFMERTSRRLPCDWTTEDVARYMGAPLE